MGEQPGGAELLVLGREGEDLALVGGAVRDLLMGRAPRELDVVSGEEAGALAGRLAEMLGGEAAGEETRRAVHERFGTAAVRWPAGRVDIARRRAESYPAPGALPEVRPGTPEEDLDRRDFTVNAIAVPLDGAAPPRLLAAEHALEDLGDRRLRVLHDASFSDDPTRLLRLARYRARLGFTIEEATARLAREALAAGALGTVSGARIGAELRLALAEPDPASALEALEELGVLRAIDGRLALDASLVRRALALVPAGEGCAETVALAALLHGFGGAAEGAAAGAGAGGPAEGAQAGAGAGGPAQNAQPRAAARACAGDAETRAAEMRKLLDRLEFPAGVRDAAIAAATSGPSRLAAVQAAPRPSAVRAEFGGQPLASVVLAAALASAGSPAAEALGQWLAELRHVGLVIDGADLIAAGVPAGPDLGRRLEAVLDARLDGRLGEDREAQLRAALGEGGRP